jgi:hypothetical protein
MGYLNRMKTQTKILLAVLVAYVIYLLAPARYEAFQDAAGTKVSLIPKKCSSSKDCPSRFDCVGSKCVDSRIRV